MKKIMGLILACAILMNTGVFAESSPQVEISSTQYHISGVLKEATFNRIAFVTVKNSAGDVVHFDGVKTANDGSFDYYFTMPKNAPTGIYTFLLSGYNSSEPITLKLGENSEITYINPKDIQDALDAVNMAGDDMQSVVETNKQKLRIIYGPYASYYESLGNDFKKNLADEIKKGVPYTDIDAFDAVFNKALALEALKASEPQNTQKTLDDFKDYYTIEDKKTYPLYETLSAEKETVFKKFTSNLTSYDDFAKNFDTAVVLTGISKANSWGEVSDILTKYGADVSYTGNQSYTGIIAKAVIGKDYANITELNSAANMAVSGLAIQTGGGSGGGSGSGSSSKKDTGSSLPTVVPTYTQTQNPPVEKPLYKDIKEAAWAEDAITFLSEKNIMSGYDGNVYPNKVITREEFVRLVVDAFGLFEEGSDVEFDDISKDEWSYKYIACAAEKGIVHGVDENNFGKGMQISRQDMAVMIMRAMSIAKGVQPDETETLGFTDEDSIADYAKSSVGFMQKSGALNGFEDGTFRPSESATRAQAATVLYIILK